MRIPFFIPVMNGRGVIFMNPLGGFMGFGGLAGGFRFGNFSAGRFPRGPGKR